MNETMELINRLSNERQVLWRKAGQGGLSVQETNRVKELTDKLYTTWDQYRREYAGDKHFPNSTFAVVNRVA